MVLTAILANSPKLTEIVNRQTQMYAYFSGPAPLSWTLSPTTFPGGKEFLSQRLSFLRVYTQSSETQMDLPIAALSGI